jgi:hypothetical protein
MYVPVTDDGEPFYSQGFAVRFYKTDGTDWVANFSPGWTNLKTVIELADNTNLLVIAFGTCYLMNPDLMKPLSVFGVGFSKFFKMQDKRLVLQDETRLTIVEKDGNYWNTERISWGEIKELELDKAIIKGLAHDPMDDADEWASFSYNIDTNELIGGSYPRRDNIKKLKWRFW